MAAPRLTSPRPFGCHRDAGATAPNYPNAVDAFLTLRPVRADDEPFLRNLRAHVDVERLGLQHWKNDDESVEMARRVVDMQFAAHAAHYRQVKSARDTKDCIIELNGHPVGRFIVTQDAERVNLSDIAVHPNFRGQGIGVAVIQSTMNECQGSKRLLHLQVDVDNSVLQLYLNLGFRVIGEGASHYLMEWVPPSLIGQTQVFAPKTTP